MDNYDKLWLQDGLNRVAVTRALQAIENTGYCLPCRVVSVQGAIVTVAFEVNADALPQVTIPKAESPWIRMPTQVGDFGLAVPATVSLGAISGLGTGTPDLARTGNLSALLFVPVSSQKSPPSNQNMAYVQGPDGATVQTTTGTASSAVVNTSGITLTFGSSSLTLNGSEITMNAGGKTVTLNSTGLTIDGILFDTHVHGGVTSGSAITLGPQA